MLTAFLLHATPRPVMAFPAPYLRSQYVSSSIQLVESGHPNGAKIYHVASPTAVGAAQADYGGVLGYDLNQF